MLQEYKDGTCGKAKTEMSKLMYPEGLGIEEILHPDGRMTTITYDRRDVEALVYRVLKLENEKQALMRAAEKPETFEISGTVKLFQVKPEDTLCTCCGGKPHVAGIHLEIPHKKYPNGTCDASVEDYLTTWMWRNRFELEGKIVKVTFEVVIE
jgi:hypothetical protein